MAEVQADAPAPQSVQVPLVETVLAHAVHAVALASCAVVVPGQAARIPAASMKPSPASQVMPVVTHAVHAVASLVVSRK